MGSLINGVNLVCGCLRFLPFLGLCDLFSELLDFDSLLGLVFHVLEIRGNLILVLIDLLQGFLDVFLRLVDGWVLHDFF